ncbi:MAG: hypothetical protein ACOVQ2_02760 [Flavobacterium sp.]
MKIIFYYLTFFIFFKTFSQKSYVDYHKQINKAEELFFKDNKKDSAFYYYDKTFGEFKEFVFLKDILNVLQLSIVEKREYEKYIELGFNNGLKLLDLNNFPIIKNKKINILKFQKKYDQIRKKYIQKIDLEYLQWVYNLTGEDQIVKERWDGFYENIYLPKKINELKNKIIEKGYPGDRIIGITDSTIFKELNSKFYRDYTKIKMVKKVKEDHSSYEFLSASFLFPFHMHHYCTFYYFEDLWLKQIAMGNIHPRDVAYIHDDHCRYLNNKKYFINSCVNKLNSKFYILRNVCKNKDFDLKSSDEQRKKWLIVSHEIDSLKRDFEIINNVNLFYGYLRNR